MDAKNILLSTGFWTSVVTAACVVIQAKTGWVIPPEQQLYFVPLLILLVRAVAKRPLRNPFAGKPAGEPVPPGLGPEGGTSDTPYCASSGASAPCRSQGSSGSPVSEPVSEPHPNPSDAPVAAEPSPGAADPGDPSPPVKPKRSHKKKPAAPAEVKP